VGSAIAKGRWYPNGMNIITELRGKSEDRQLFGGKDDIGRTPAVGLCKIGATPTVAMPSDKHGEKRNDGTQLYCTSSSVRRSVQCAVGAGLICALARHTKHAHQSTTTQWEKAKGRAEFDNKHGKRKKEATTEQYHPERM
jgi:hypothetical protein